LAYATHADLEDKMGHADFSATTDLEDKMGIEDFSTTTIPTATQVDSMLEELSAMWDGLAQQTEDIETPTEHVKQAILAAGQYQVDQIRIGEPVDQLVIIKIFKQFMVFHSKDYSFYDQQYAYNTGKW
jgi:hypothetical protein